MKTVFKKKIITICSALFIGILFPIAVFAQLHAGTSTDAHDGDVIAVHITADTEGKSINAVSGTVALGAEKGVSYTVVGTSIANSSFSVWPRSPSVSEDQKTISFTGGATSPVIGAQVDVFTIFLKVAGKGIITLHTTQSSEYLSDGLGTTIQLPDTSDSISVTSSIGAPYNAQEEMLTGDGTPPNPFSIHILQDKDLFNGLKFASFETTDNGSGISHYEVQEGTKEFIITGATYVLQDQHNTHRLIVKAYDTAGNVRIETYTPPLLIAVQLGILIGILVGAALIYIRVKKKRAKK